MVEIIYKEPIKVICVNSKISTKLIENGIYLANSIYTDKSLRIVCLNNVGRYNANSFTLLDGTPLKEQPDFNIENNRLDLKDKTYTGQFVKCRYSSGKTLKENEIYYVEEHKKIPVIGWGGQIRHEDKFKIRGIKNFVNAYRFLDIPITEQRKIKLKNLKGEVTKTGEQTRKFLLYTEKEKMIILFETLSKIISDLKYVNLTEKPDFVELMLSKGKNYNLIEEDITKFLSMVKPLLEIF